MNKDKIVFEEFVLEQVNLEIPEHEAFIIKLMRDNSVQKEFFLNKEQFVNKDIKRSELIDKNSFIITIEDIPVGYLETGPISNGSVSISFAIEKSFRRNGYGALILSSLTDSLLDREDIDRISAIISNKNEASIRLFEKCGFTRSENVPNCFEKVKTLNFDINKLG